MITEPSELNRKTNRLPSPLSKSMPKLIEPSEHKKMYVSMNAKDIRMNPAFPVPTPADMKDDLSRIKNAKTWLLAQDVPEKFSAEDMNLLSDIIQAGVPPLTDYPDYEKDLLRTMQVDAAAYWIWLQSECGEANLFHAILKRFADLRTCAGNVWEWVRAGYPLRGSEAWKHVEHKVDMHQDSINLATFGG